MELNAGDIGLQAGGPQALPRYQLAARQQRLLKAILAASIILIASMLAIWWYQVSPAWQPVLVAQTAMLLVLTASLQRVWWITRWRVRVLNAASQDVTAGRGAELQPGQVLISQPFINLVEPRVVLSLFTHCRAGLRARWIAVLIVIQQHGDGLAALGVGLLASAALLLVAGNWDWQPNLPENLYAGHAPAKFLIAFSLLLLAFAALVLERYYGSVRSSSHSNELPEAPQIAYQLRVGITVSLLLCVAVLLGNDTRQWPLRILVWIGLLPAAVAVELLLRAVLSLFAPPTQDEPELLAASLFAALWRWPIKPFAHFQDELKQRFGIDLRQSWAFAYIRRALLPVVAVLLGVAWVLSGLFEIPIAERGIYERFGAPVAVWQPGIHWGLPWPLGRVQRIENGVVHELSAAVGDKDSREPAPELTTAEGLPPASANRLWDASHVAEKSQIIASEVSGSAGNRQSFHIVNMDVRFMYRIGLSDGAALKGRYTSADAPALIRSTANRILVRYFASRTLEGVLGETRTRMATDIGTQLQADLDILNSGVEIMTTLLEAIHPPAAAANAYHAVQAAQINAQAIISRERGNSAKQINLAQLRAGIARDQATAAARETLAAADVAKRRFSAERDAYRQGGKAFLLEQYFARLTQGLSNARVTLVDHRLPAASTTIDLRDFSAAVDSGAGNSARPVAVSTDALRKADYQGSP